MTIEIGSTVQGTVVKLADYGAIVRLAGGKMGLVHISEVADAYVRDIRDYFRENDHISVKVLKVNDKGRYELSTRQADVQVVPRAERPKEPRVSVLEQEEQEFRETSRDRHRVPVNFEDRLSKFMKDSEERQGDLKRNIESKRGGGRR